MDKNTRSEINRALAKSIAYRDCGNETLAAEWAGYLVHLLECSRILALDANTQRPER